MYWILQEYQNKINSKEKISCQGYLIISLTSPLLPFYKTQWGRVTKEVLRCIKAYFPKIPENSGPSCYGMIDHAAAWSWILKTTPLLLCRGRDKSCRGMLLSGISMMFNILRHDSLCRGMTLLFLLFCSFWSFFL